MDWKKIFSVHYAWPLFLTLLLSVVVYFVVPVNDKVFVLFNYYGNYFVFKPLEFILLNSVSVSLAVVTIYQLGHLFRPLASAVYMLVAAICSGWYILSIIESFEASAQEDYSSLVNSLTLLLMVFFGLFLVNLFTVIKQLRTKRKV